MLPRIASRPAPVYRPAIGRALGSRLTGIEPAFVLLMVGLGFGFALATQGVLPVDAGIYFRASSYTELYGKTWLVDGLFVYPPPFAMFLAPLRLLGPAGFTVVWAGLLFAALGLAGRWWSLAVVVGGVLLLPAVGPTTPVTNPLILLLIGNAQALVAAAIVLGFRYPAAWSLVLLTKMLPGVGLLWFVFRREWRSLGIAVGATAVIAIGSVLIAPSAWVDFFAFLVGNKDTPSSHEVLGVPLWVRLVAAVALIGWGARTDRRWTVPIACGLASLALYQWSYVTIWLGALVLARPDPSFITGLRHLPVRPRQLVSS